MYYTNVAKFKKFRKLKPHVRRACCKDVVSSHAGSEGIMYVKNNKIGMKMIARGVLCTTMLFCAKIAVTATPLIVMSKGCTCPLEGYISNDLSYDQ